MEARPRPPIHHAAVLTIASVYIALSLWSLGHLRDNLVLYHQSQTAAALMIRWLRLAWILVVSPLGLLGAAWLLAWRERGRLLVMGIAIAGATRRLIDLLLLNIAIGFRPLAHGERVEASSIEITWAFGAMYVLVLLVLSRPGLRAAFRRSTPDTRP